MRCREEVDYQHRAIVQIADMRTRTETWNTSNDIPTKITRPITNWYMFSNRDGWEEDTALENRLRRVAKGKSTAVLTAGTNPIMPVILGWHDVRVFALKNYDCPYFYIEVPNALSRMEVTPLISAPSPLLPMQNFQVYRYTEKLSREIYSQVVIEEAAELSVATFMHTSRY